MEREAQGPSPERMCALTRERAPKGGLIRFVAGPDGALVPDLRANLPGRGVYVTCERAKVEEAVRRNVFARGLKRAVVLPRNLAELVDELLEEQALAALSMARKAGAALTGAEKVDDLVRTGSAAGLLHASDAAGDGLRKLVQATRAVVHLDPDMRIPVWRPFDAAALGLATGGLNVVHVGLKDDGAGRNCLAKVAQLTAYRALEPANADVLRTDDGEAGEGPEQPGSTAGGGRGQEAGDGRTPEGRPGSDEGPRASAPGAVDETERNEPNRGDAEGHSPGFAEGDEDAR